MEDQEGEREGGSDSRSVMSDSLRPHGLEPTRLLCPWNSPGKNTGVGCRFLLQGIFPAQGLNPDLQHCRKTLYCLSHQGNILKIRNKSMLKTRNKRTFIRKPNKVRWNQDQEFGQEMFS